jgi:hypothetical protein
MKTTAVLIIGGGMLCSALLSTRADGPAQTTPPADDLMKAEGRVLDPAGRPVSGAKVYLNPLTAADTHGPRATSDAGGRFKFTFRKSEIPGEIWQAEPWKEAYIAAHADGFGPAWMGVEALSGQPITLNLVEDDVPIDGAIEDLEGRPLEGIIVRPEWVGEPLSGQLDAFIEAFREHPFWDIFQRGRYFRLRFMTGLPAEIKTDAQGRFRLSGVGRERVVAFRTEGPNIEQLQIYAVTRAGIDFKRVDRSSPSNKSLMEGGWVMPVVYGNKFHHLANPTRPIVGTIRERGTGKPIADATVSAGVSGREVFVSNTRTDAEGHYRVVGLPTEGRVSVFAVRRPYLGQNVTRTIESAGAEPVTMDVELPRGIVIRGRITDAATGKPVRGRVAYFPLSDNAYLRTAPGFSFDLGVHTDRDGSYETVGLPGSAVLLATALEDKFTMSRPEQWGVPADEQGFFSTAAGLKSCREAHRVARIEPKKGAATLEQDFALERGITITGKLVEPDGQPVEQGRAFGLHALGHQDDLEGGGFTVTGLERERPRTVWFMNSTRTLGRMMALPTDDAGPLTIKLQSCGTFIGRVVDGRGRPRPNVGVVAVVQVGVDSPNPGRSEVRTDADGRFRIAGLIPGPSYIVATGDSAYRQTDITVRSGEVKDLGDLRTDN